MVIANVIDGELACPDCGNTTFVGSVDGYFRQATPRLHMVANEHMRLTISAVLDPPVRVVSRCRTAEGVVTTKWTLTDRFPGQDQEVAILCGACERPVQVPATVHVSLSPEPRARN